ncbi:malonyl-CoA O-methyltransferase [Bacillus pakistanensis]|uniref:Malonyl-[acyl-carrier protein] O-methyltransferase n=1 Tax=Rossellomorea pakistanensis TaxID=992288 RepID=A0ABS2NJ76_9BACI|nr:malonyl-ACP O-methyltransferase BioC [Bacillus pakistanensis]MBM7587894.1 malonyl-CoA O-methyltransferase [Bacillus pakistanensis]
MINKQLLQKRFSKNARNYDKYAKVQKKMGMELIQTLPKIENAETIDVLEIGCGTGYVTQLLCETYLNVRITAIDLAPGMIERAKERTKGMNGITFFCGDIEELSFSSSYDLIISNATFQWLNDFQSVIEKLYGLLNEDGRIVFSTFGNKTFHELHTSSRKAKETLNLPIHHTLGQSFYAFEDLYQLCEQVLQSFSAFPYEMKGKQLIETEYFPTVKDFFTSIKKIGANNSNKEGSYLGPAFFKELFHQYETNFMDERGVKASYHCLFFSMIKK